MCRVDKRIFDHVENNCFVVICIDILYLDKKVVPKNIFWDDHTHITIETGK